MHEAVHSLLECCLQLHPAAAQRFYEAAKKVMPWNAALRADAAK